MEDYLFIAGVIYLVRAVWYGVIGDTRRCGLLQPMLAALLCGPVTGDILAAVLILSSEKKTPI